ncbi:hypothetical protein [Cohnella sp. JJ-181]|uniref:hypothetical protein n=1 Tax=Cohnella rhizoplanae TaxID=2974897 RepID=UPI0022FFC024|nr:hypothetical protein [Cohnella sp. JJ-181]CAI6031301.1 hypothetical protein COHCIP112018_00711 [Cohnella sp. JJ-181]
MNVLSIDSRKILLAALVAAALAGSSHALAAPAATPAAAARTAAHDVPASEYALFLKDKFAIALTAGISKGEFLSAFADALKAPPAEAPHTFTDLRSDDPLYADAASLYALGVITSDAVNAGQRLSAINAVQIAVKAAGLKELAYTYPAAKTAAALAKVNLKPASLGTAASQELAAAIDTGLLPASYYAEIKLKGSASRDLAEVLIGQTLSVQGLYKHFLGYASDADIYAKLQDAFTQSDIIQSPELQAVVDAALERNIVTGYNLKDSRYEANFVDSLSLVYGHSDLKHGLQLIGLLRSEGIEAKIQFEPKTSAFIYLKEWGEPGESDLYTVKQIANGNYIEYAKEYDLALEFSTAADKARFDAIVSAYAKKNEDDQQGLLYGSWWQPLYYSLTELQGYEKITNNKIEHGHYYAQSFSLRSASDAVAAGFRDVDPKVVVERYDFWTDVPFYNYLNGESK